MCSSRSCFSSTGEGRCVKQSWRAASWKGDHVADRFVPTIMATNAVQPEGDAAVRRRAVLQRIQEEPEFLLRSSAPIERALTPSTAPPRGDAHRPPPISEPIQHHVEALASADPGSVASLSSWPSLGAVNGWCMAFQALGLLVVPRNREVNHPQRFPPGLRVAFLVADFTRSAPSASFTPWPCRPEDIRSPFFAPERSTSAFNAASERFFTIGDCMPSLPFETSLA